MFSWRDRVKIIYSLAYRANFCFWPLDFLNKNLICSQFFTVVLILSAVFKNHLSFFWKSFIVEIIFYLENGGSYEFLNVIFLFSLHYLGLDGGLALIKGILRLFGWWLSKMSLVVKKVFDQKIEKPLKKYRKIRVVKEGNLNKFGAIF